MERLEGHIIEKLSGAGKLDEADQSRHRRILDYLHHEADCWTECYAKGLRQDHVAQRLGTAKRK
ncbi:hypothetical protein D3C80_2180630 [compost metagenome]